MSVGERIKARRKELSLSADFVAEKLGVSRSTVFRYENGAIEKLPADALEPIAKVLRTTVAALMGWEDIAPTEATQKAAPDSQAQLLNLSAAQSELVHMMERLSDDDQQMLLRLAKAAFPPKE